MGTVYNFSAGPAMLPARVMAQAQRDFCDHHGLGYGIMEASHRSPEFGAVIERAETNIRDLTGLGPDYAVLFLQGGASLQFSMLAMNLLAPDRTAAYISTGSWSEKAIEEAERLGNVQVVASGKTDNYSRIPAPDSWVCPVDAAYLHITTNNTIYGTQYQYCPTAPDGVPLVADMSSDILSRQLDFSRFGLIYAGAQKNLGPSGCTVVLMRKDLAERAGDLPTMLAYRTHISKSSLFNTPPTFAIYMIQLVTDWIRVSGGLAAVQAVNERKAARLYSVIDADDFYTGPAAVGDRSRMNVCFRLPDAALEPLFLSEAAQRGLHGLKGHRLVGGMRASIYNAMTMDGVEALAAFMTEFRDRQG